MSNQSGLLTRLLYSIEESSLNQFSQKSGIPYSTLWNFKNGKRALPSHWEDSLYWFYSQEVQERAVKYGLQLEQAIDLSYLSPTRVHTTLGAYIEKINYLTQNSIARKLYREGKEITMEYIRKNFGETRERVINSIKAHDRTINEVLNERY